MKKVCRSVLLSLSMILFMLSITQCTYGDVEPNYIPNGGFYGYVTDNGGNPIAGVTIKAADYQATTDANGFYNIFIGGQLCTQLIAEKDNYFKQVKTAFTGDSPTQVDFQLTDDPSTMVTVMALFPDTPYAYMKYTWGYEHTVTIRAYTGAFGHTIESTEEVTQSVDSPYPARSTKRRAFASGVYNATGALLDLFIKRFDQFYDQFYENEYLNPNNVVGETWGILPG